MAIFTTFIFVSLIVIGLIDENLRKYVNLLSLALPASSFITFFSFPVHLVNIL